MRVGLSLAVLLVSMSLVPAALLVGTDARAQGAGGSGSVAVIPAATQSDAGAMRYVITACKNEWPFPERRVAVYANSSDFSARGYAALVLDTALKIAWAQCPQHFIFVPGTEFPGFHKDVSSVDVYYSGGSVAIHAENYKGDRGTQVGSEYAWRQITYPTDEQREAAAQQAARDQERAAQQAAAQQYYIQRGLWRSRTWRTIKTIFWIGIGLLATSWLFKRRYAIARWYYFTFHPHPAQQTVQTAIDTGALLNGQQLAGLLGDEPSSNSILRQVRFEQSKTLIAAMEAATQYRLKQLRASAADHYEQAAVQQAQAALAQAAIALEQAKTYLNASKRSAQR